jgi:methylmalonyl-CoA mutase
MGLQGMINDLVRARRRCRRQGVPRRAGLAGLGPATSACWPHHHRLENGEAPALKEPLLKEAAEPRRLGITGTGGAGKSS